MLLPVVRRLRPQVGLAVAVADQRLACRLLYGTTERQLGLRPVAAGGAMLLLAGSGTSGFGTPGQLESLLDVAE